LRSIAALVTELEKAGVALFLQGDGVGFKAHSVPPADAVLKALSLRKLEVIQYLRARACADPPAVVSATGPAVPSIVQEMWWNWIDPDTSLTLSLIEFIGGFSGYDRLVSALEEIVAGHDTLRSSFTEDSGVLRVVLNDAARFRVETQLLPGSTAKEELKALIDEFIGRPMPATSPWLVRGKVFALPGYGAIAVVVANHIVVDGTSMDILRSELRRRIKDSLAIGPTRPALHYADFAQWQRRCAAMSGQALSDYWRGWMRSQPELCNPGGTIPMRWQPGRKVRRTFTIPPFAHQALAEKARRHATFPFLIYLTLLALSTARWSGQSEFPLRSICDLRTRPELASMVGLMTGADSIHMCVDLRAEFAENLEKVEKEYYASTRIRLPNIYAFPPFAIRPLLEENMQRDNISVVMNYRKTPAYSSDLKFQDAWPPAEGEKRRDLWRHAVSPICLELTQLGDIATAAFLLHEDILPVRSQDSFIRTFFDTFAEEILRETRLPGEPPVERAIRREV
jgi:hypothetical protein